MKTWVKKACYSTLILTYSGTAATFAYSGIHDIAKIVKAEKQGKNVSLYSSGPNNISPKEAGMILTGQDSKKILAASTGIIAGSGLFLAGMCAAGLVNARRGRRK